MLMELFSNKSASRTAWISGAALWFGMSLSQVVGAETAPAPAPSPVLKPMPQNQKKIGAEIQHLGNELDDVLEEVRANLGVEAPDFAPHGRSRKKLGELSEEDIPR